jgi:hypothetical protein
MYLVVTRLKSISKKTFCNLQQKFKLCNSWFAILDLRFLICNVPLEGTEYNVPQEGTKRRATTTTTTKPSLEQVELRSRLKMDFWIFYGQGFVIISQMFRKKVCLLFERMRQSSPVPKLPRK